MGTEHFWLALLKEGEGVAVSLLRSMGVDTQEMQQKILEALAKSSPTAARTPPHPAAKTERPKAAFWKNTAAT